MTFISIVLKIDLYVYLSNKSTFTYASDDAGAFIDLGKLPYNEGTFSVDIPSVYNETTMKSDLIWDLFFSVVFTYATLTTIITL